jgi:prepilin-type N-terminal cleavage/methylation domain-containing protein/prepilin-type processing-associated H-X9-DG protein
VNPGPVTKPARGWNKTRERGFSLIELMIVLVVILLALTTVTGGKGGRRQQQLAQCEGNLHSVFVALQTYANANSNMFPVVSNARTSDTPLSLLVPQCTTSANDFICPASGDSELPQAKPFARRKISYAYYMGRRDSDSPDQPLLSDRQVDDNPKPVGTPLFSSNGKKPGNNHGDYGGNILFCDGSVKTSPAASAFNLTNSPGVVLLNPKP